MLESVRSLRKALKDCEVSRYGKVNAAARSLSISTAPENVDWALSLADYLIRLARKHGCDSAGHTFTINEHSLQRRHQATAAELMDPLWSIPKFDYTPTGKIAVSARCESLHWSTKDVPRAGSRCFFTKS